MRTIFLIKLQNLRKEKYLSHTIAHLTVFTRAFCHTRVENLLKGPALVLRRLQWSELLLMTSLKIPVLWPIPQFDSCPIRTTNFSLTCEKQLFLGETTYYAEFTPMKHE